MKLHKKFTSQNSFEDHYNEVRGKEKRILNLEQIKKLPETEPSYVHHPEWNKRIKSTNRLIKYLSKKNSELSILDIGCGNGWLMNKLVPFTEYLVGIDINLLELEQAEELMKDCDNVALYYADLFELNFEKTFDQIILNASIQYFADLNQLIPHLVKWLKPNGEIHIIDSPFYSSKAKSQAAMDRSVTYYDDVGVPKMAEFYHHHTLQDLSPFRFELKYNPSKYLNKIKHKLSPDSPFYWVIVR